MLKKLLTVAAIVVATPSFVFADNIFFAFGRGTDATDTATATTADGTGSVYIYSDAAFAFDAADLYFSSSDDSVVQFTGGVAVDDPFDVVGDTKFNSLDVTVPPSGMSPPPTVDGRFLAVNVDQNGVNPELGVLFDPNYDADAGANGAFLHARLDYNIIGEGVTDFTFSFGPNGAVLLDTAAVDPDDRTIVLNPTFGSATLTVLPVSAIPEPSSLALVVLGSVGLVARRRRT